MVGQILATEVWMCHRLETPRCSVLRICLFQDTPKRVGPAEVYEYISPLLPPLPSSEILRLSIYKEVQLHGELSL